MNTRFHTKVVRHKHPTKHQSPEIVSLTICEDGGGIFLLLEDAKGSCFDNWYESVEQAKRHVDDDYEITGWVTPPP